jgi:hypothetical protein
VRSFEAVAPAHREDDAGRQRNATLGSSHLPDNATSKPVQEPSPAAQARLQFLAARLHALGPKPLFHFLDEVERGEPLRAHLERYAALPADPRPWRRSVPETIRD